MPGDVTLHEPGRNVPVTLVADGSGNVPQYGEIVGIVGESGRGTHVSYPAAAGDGIGHLVGEPVDIDEDATFAAGDVVGEAMIKLRAAVDWFPVAAAYTAPAANDLVVSETDGTVRAIDRDGTAPDDTVDMVMGRVFTTLQRAEGTADKVAVIRT